MKELCDGAGLKGDKPIIAYCRLGERYHCQIDNVEPGANIARTNAETREEAERNAIEDARRRLARTRVRS